MDFSIAAAGPGPVTSGVLLERIVLVAIGALLGFVIGWLWRAGRPAAPDTRVEGELRSQLAAREAALAQARAAASAADAARAGAEARHEAAATRAADLDARLAASVAEAAARRADVAGAREQLATARAEVDAGRQLQAEERRFHEDAQREAREQHDAALTELRAASEKSLAALRDQFKALAADALRENSPEFLRLASATFEKLQAGAAGDLALRQESVAALVKPLAEQLQAYQQRLQQTENGQQQALGQVKEQLVALAQRSDLLSGETQRLRVVLSSNQARGRWGEETLRRVVEAAGLSPHCDFEPQVQESDKRPDLLVRLPGNRVIIVDSKVPDLDFLNALNLADETRRTEALALHAQKLRATIKALADRNYAAQFPEALDFVVLFLPAESLFSAALEGDRDLIVWAAERHILLATPASLIALLRSVSVSWQQHEQSVNAREIAAAARTLYERVAKFIEHFERLRDALQKAGAAYDSAVGSYERMVRPAGERLATLGGTDASQALPEVAPIDLTLRLPPAA